jgi:hypothetical protein
MGFVCVCGGGVGTVLRNKCFLEGLVLVTERELGPRRAEEELGPHREGSALLEARLVQGAIMGLCRQPPHPGIYYLYRNCAHVHVCAAGRVNCSVHNKTEERLQLQCLYSPS